MPDQSSPTNIAPQTIAPMSARPATPEAAFLRNILLNRMVSRSITRAPQEHSPPVHGALELLQIIDARRKSGSATEVVGHGDGEEDEGKDHKSGSVIRLRDSKFGSTEQYDYIFFLFEYIDESAKAFPVVDRVTYAGREISGEIEERGAITAHVAVRCPKEVVTDTGVYRCAVEAASPLTRRNIEFFLSKQLLRHSKDNDFKFGVSVQKKRKVVENEYKYRPRLELHADVARTLGSAAGGRELSQLVFTKRSEKQSVGLPTVAQHEDIIADLEVRVSAKQAPSDATERANWFTRIRNHYHMHGYETKVYYRHQKAGVVSGAIHESLDGAADLLLCPRETISLPAAPRRWEAVVNQMMVAKLTEVLDRDDLWERSAR